MGTEEKNKFNKETLLTKHCKGITLISLSITIIVIIIISGIAIDSGVTTIRNSRLTQFNTELKIIHAKVNEIAEENRTQEELNTLGQTIDQLNSSTQGKITTAMQGASIDGFRYFNQANLESIGVSNIKREVIINFQTREVVDINGVKKDGVYIYRIEGWNNIEYEDKNTEVPEFTVSKKIYGLTATIQMENIVYKGNVNKGTFAFCLYNNETEGTWKNISGEKFSINQSGIYKIRLTDGAGNTADKIIEVVLVNEPKLEEGMTPVIYDESIGKWRIVAEDGGLWYDYASDKKQWANVMLQDNLTINNDGTIDNDKMGSMFVWIPRYMYQIESGYHPDASTQLPLEGSINIKFLRATTNLATDGSNLKISTESGQGNWIVHPAFTSNTSMGGENKEITGFWVAKFEASSNTTTASNPNTGAKLGRTNNDTDNVRSVPNVTSWRSITVPQIVKACKRMTAEGNIYGLATNVTSKMMKNSQWGAIAYLTQSDYGNKQVNSDSSSGVWNNSYHIGDSYYTTKTGMVGGTRDSATSSGTASTVYYEYNTENGIKGTTTRNIYGIYDLAGGAWEYIAGYLEAGTNEYTTYFKTLQLSEKQEYAGTGENTTEGKKANYQANSKKYGDALWETSRDDAGNGWHISWNGDCAGVPYVSYPFFIRGGSFDYVDAAGLFAFASETGGASHIYSFRPVLVI